MTSGEEKQKGTCLLADHRSLIHKMRFLKRRDDQLFKLCKVALEWEKRKQEKPAFNESTKRSRGREDGGM